MFGPRIPLFKILGCRIRLDWSWFLIALLVTWTLASSVFPALLAGLTTGSYWIMGAVGALGLFVSILLHELGHAVVARAHGLRIEGITLFVFGGVAELRDEPRSPKVEFLVAVAGPVVSVALCGLFFLGGFLCWMAGAPDAVRLVLNWLGTINGAVVVFNLVPGFPLDGGRMLRAALWQWRKSLRWATRITSRMGSGFGIALILLGALDILGGNLIGGMWLALIGLFLRGAAQMSYLHLIARQLLEGKSVRSFLEPHSRAVSPTITLRELVDEHVYRRHFNLYPVVEDGALRGCIRTRQLAGIPRDRWASTPVADVAQECPRDSTIDPDADAMEALSRMQRTRKSALVVAENGRFAGVLSLKGMMQFLSLKMQLEADGDDKPQSDRREDAAAAPDEPVAAERR